LIVVVEPDPKLVEELRRELEGLGWTCEVSIGEEQAVLSLSGGGRVEELQAALRARSADLIPLRSAREYAHVRARRLFMTGLSSGLGVMAALGLGVPVVGFLLPPRKDLSTPDLVRAAGAGELPDNSAKMVRLLGVPVLLVHQGGERYFALSAVCTHMNVCHLEWSRERQQLVCPCHGGAFDVYGNVVQGPPSVPLPSYDVERVGDELFIRRKA